MTFLPLAAAMGATARTEDAKGNGLQPGWVISGRFTEERRRIRLKPLSSFLMVGKFAEQPAMRGLPPGSPQARILDASEVDH